MNGDGVRITVTETGVQFRVRVTPRARESAIDGVMGDTLKIRLAAPPVDGAANDELIELIARAFGVPRSRVALARGATSRAKTVRIAGISDTQARARIRALLVAAGK